MSIVTQAQQLSDTVASLLLDQNTEDAIGFQRGGSLPSHSLNYNQLTPSATWSPTGVLKFQLPSTGLLSSSHPMVVSWTITQNAAGTVTNPSAYVPLWYWARIDLLSNNQIVSSLTPASLIQFMKATLQPTAYDRWFSVYCSYTPATNASETTISFSLPILWPGFSDEHSMLDLKRSAAKYSIQLTPAAQKIHYGSGNAVLTTTTTPTLDYVYVELSDSDDQKFVQATYNNADSSLVRSLSVSNEKAPFALTTAGVVPAQLINETRLVESISFYFSNANTNDPLTLVAGSVSINFGAGTTTIPLKTLRAFNLYKANAYASANFDGIYNLPLTLLPGYNKNFVGGVAMRVCSSAYISLSGLEATAGTALPTTNEFHLITHAKTIVKASALTGQMVEVVAS